MEITSWTLIQLKRSLKTENIKLAGECLVCPQAMWKATRISRDELYDTERPRYYSLSKGSYEENPLEITCYCTLSHEYQIRPVEFCDGNPPQVEPKLG